jgi:hypothetical protein
MYGLIIFSGFAENTNINQAGYRILGFCDSAPFTSEKGIGITQAGNS